MARTLVQPRVTVTALPGIGSTSRFWKFPPSGWETRTPAPTRLGLRLYEVTAERALMQPEPLARWFARVLAAAVATRAALVLPDLSTLTATDGGELLLPLLRAHRGIAFAHARERSLFSGAP